MNLPRQLQENADIFMTAVILAALRFILTIFFSALIMTINMPFKKTLAKKSGRHAHADTHRLCSHYQGIKAGCRYRVNRGGPR